MCIRDRPTSLKDLADPVYKGFVSVTDIASSSTAWLLIQALVSDVYKRQPLLGFGNVLWQGVKEAVDQHGFIGIFMGGFTASAVGISAALIFGYLAALIFDPKMKK